MPVKVFLLRLVNSLFLDTFSKRFLLNLPVGKREYENEPAAMQMLHLGPRLLVVPVWRQRHVHSVLLLGDPNTSQWHSHHFPLKQTF